MVRAHLRNIRNYYMYRTTTACCVQSLHFSTGGAGRPKKWEMSLKSRKMHQCIYPQKNRPLFLNMYFFAFFLKYAPTPTPRKKGKHPVLIQSLESRKKIIWVIAIAQLLFCSVRSQFYVLMLVYGHALLLLFLLLLLPFVPPLCGENDGKKSPFGNSGYHARGCLSKLGRKGRETNKQSKKKRAQQ